MNRRELLRVSALAALSGNCRAPFLFAAPDPPVSKNPDEMIHAYLAGEVKRLSLRFMDGAKTKTKWEEIRPRLKREFLEMVGLDPLPEKTPLKAAKTGTIERSGITIENVHFQSRPGLYVTGNLYLPKASEKKEKHPAILYVCGHSSRGRDGNKTAFQDHGLWFASNGYVCLVIDTLQLGEVAGTHHGTYRYERWWWQDNGYTPAGVECWNGIRAIDYLSSRPEVDAGKIGVTGISGGGASTVWIAADERVKVAVPVSGMSDLECCVTDEVVNGHCDCMFPVNTYQWELTTILALFAPRPLLFANSDNDTIFPMTGNRRIATRLRTCYALLGAKDHFDEYVSKGGHDYRPDLRLAIFGFFHKHLKGDNTAIKDADFPKIEGKDLRVFPTDADLPKDSLNAKIDETFVPTANVKLPATAKDFQEWKSGLIQQLREKCFRGLPEKGSALEYIRGKDDEYERVRTEPGIVVGYKESMNDKPLPFLGYENTIIVMSPDDDREKLIEKFMSIELGTIVTLYPRGGEGSKWSRKNPPNTVERSLALVGQTADSGRVRDVAALLRKDKIQLFGKGQAGIIAAYAALLTSKTVIEVVVADPPVSHRDGPHFLNVLRILDIPEALGLLAPDIRLTLMGAKDKAFDRTAAIYKAAGSATKFKRV